MKVRPIQKTGREKVVNETVTDPVSTPLPRRDETTTPKRTPITMPRTVEDPKRRRVLKSLPEPTMSSMTGCWVLNEFPKLNVSMPQK